MAIEAFLISPISNPEALSRRGLFFARGRGGGRKKPPSHSRPSFSEGSPKPPSWNPFNRLTISRRGLGIGAATLAVGGAALVVAEKLGLIDLIPTADKEETAVVDLGLRIDEEAFFRAARSIPRWETLPDATDKSKLSCQSLSPNVCQGQSSSLFKVAFNRPMAEFMFRQAKLVNPPIKTNIMFVDEWGESLDSEHGQGGFSGITADEKEQNVVIFLKRAAWHAFRAAEVQNLSIQDYFQGFLSRFVSAWTVHELGHAGAETKALWKKGQSIVPAQYEAVHPQIFAFQNRYDRLYDQVAKQGLIANALVVALEPLADLSVLRAQIFQEARQKGLE